MIILTGKNPDFKVIWNCSRQTYTVQKFSAIFGGYRFITVKFAFKDIKSYLD